MDKQIYRPASLLKCCKGYVDVLDKQIYRLAQKYVGEGIVHQFAFAFDKQKMSGGVVGTKLDGKIERIKIWVDGRFANPVAVDRTTRTAKQNWKQHDTHEAIIDVLHKQANVSTGRQL